MSDERRQDYSTMNTDIALLKNDVSYIKSMIEGNYKDFKTHVDTAQPFRDKVIGMDDFKKSFDGHVVSDRWGFGVIISLLVMILTKNMGVW